MEAVSSKAFQERYVIQTCPRRIAKGVFRPETGWRVEPEKKPSGESARYEKAHLAFDQCNYRKIFWR